ncbi:MAG: hypothetical protein A2831_02905 [Candidatus Yanofskybacteria bacterium RIFCSPHIGHO2_01_FULL_44_17]|uniref:Uncharacterized protein n=1 Tax=Candidatus Yanofskybacteria bacterium RIFCSPHIGHO2_01_FULL_44_17 TaxID=1802668 RepID=A0A1F8EUE1_9BACT|nr:MAG: hypothetical protein A2831_02905 [Candidatus Yanofskybacteria bacterium RIFCSPHIGHO2_01_FULL_44_17]
MKFLEKFFGNNNGRKEEAAIDIDADPGFQLNQVDAQIVRLNAERLELEKGITDNITPFRLGQVKQQLKVLGERRNLLWEVLNPLDK